MKSQCTIGARVSLKAQHWLRPYGTGVVIDQQQRAVKNWLIQFEEAYPGGGIDGDKLWCDESDFAEIWTPRANPLRRPQELQDFPASSDSHRMAALEMAALEKVASG